MTSRKKLTVFGIIFGDSEKDFYQFYPNEAKRAGDELKFFSILSFDSFQSSFEAMKLGIQDLIGKDLPCAAWVDTMPNTISDGPSQTLDDAADELISMGVCVIRVGLSIDTKKLTPSLKNAAGLIKITNFNAEKTWEEIQRIYQEFKK